MEGNKKKSEIIGKRRDQKYSFILCLRKRPPLALPRRKTKGKWKTENQNSNSIPSSQLISPPLQLLPFSHSFFSHQKRKNPFFNGTVLNSPAVKSKPPPLYHSSLNVSGQYSLTTPHSLCLSNSIMGSDRNSLPVLVLTMVLLFSGLWSFGLGSRARIAVPGRGAEESPSPSPCPEPGPAPAVQLLFQEQHVSGFVLLRLFPSLPFLPGTTCEAESKIDPGIIRVLILRPLMCTELLPLSFRFLEYESKFENSLRNKCRRLVLRLHFQETDVYRGNDYRARDDFQEHVSSCFLGVKEMG